MDTSSPEYQTTYLIDGEQWDYDRPLENDFTIHSIAHALARENRYNGAFTGQAYSVAEHAVLVAIIVREHYGKVDPSLRKYGLAALHHDDSEFVLKDITSPEKAYLKRAFGLDWHDVERPVMQAISNKFEIPMDEFSAGIIKDADNLAYAAEVVVLKQEHHGPILPIEPETLVKISGWVHGFQAGQAEALFIHLHESFMAEREAGYPDLDSVDGLDVEPPTNNDWDMPDDPFLS